MQLRPSESDTILAEAFGPRLTAIRFERAGSRKWVRSEKKPIRELFSIVTGKGLVMWPVWGLSLDFVPHVQGGRRVRWHRTDKSAYFDLTYDAIDDENTNGPHTRHMGIGTLQTVEAARVEASRSAEVAVPLSCRTLFNRVCSTADLPRVFEEHWSRHGVRFQFENFVQQPLAYAFVRAELLGDESAIDLLGQYLAYHDATPMAAKKLRELLESALARHTTTSNSLKS